MADDEDKLVTKPFKFVTGECPVPLSDSIVKELIQIVAGTFPFSSHRASRSTIQFPFKISKRRGHVRPLHIPANLSKYLGFDARFPNQNQSVHIRLTKIVHGAKSTSRSKHCWQNYVDYHKCILAKGEDFAPCRQVGPHTLIPLIH